MLKIFLYFIINVILYASETDYFYNHTDYAIPDNDTIGVISEVNISSENVPDGARAVEVCFIVTYDHSWRGDMSFSIISPSGTEGLALDPTGSEDGTFTDADCNSTEFTDEPIIGIWTLHAVDSGYGDTGTLLDFGIKFTYYIPDSDGDGISDDNDMYPNDGPLGDWDGDGILNNVDTDDSDGFGPNDPRAHYSQGVRTESGRIAGNKEQDTQPYPENPCGQGYPCIQGTAERNADAIPDEETPAYDDRPDCNHDTQYIPQGTNECIDR